MREESYKDLPELGIGLTYSSALESFLRSHTQFFDVIEVEPQTSWSEKSIGSGEFMLSDPVLNHIARLPGKKLVHSIGIPVGGTRHPDRFQLQLLEKTIKTLKSPWMSEHLSFNNAHDNFTGFFLPPCQTEEGIENAVAAINVIQDFVSVPIAIETGVNYFATRENELSDGLFVGEVSRRADCAILLDLHNLFTNELNGRQAINKFLEEIPLERVLEVHLAGGMEVDGFWLDAHSGAINDHLVQIALDLIPHLPNLKAIIFEVFPSFVPAIGFEVIKEQLELTRKIWNSRGSKIFMINPPHSGMGSTQKGQNESKNPPYSIVEWEKVVSDLALGRPVDPNSSVAQVMIKDRGITLVRSLIKEFRASMIVSVLRLSSRYLILALGADIFRMYLEDFWSKNRPCQYASTEAAQFGEYMKSMDLKVPQFGSLLEFELAIVETLLDGKARVTTFSVDPIPLFKALVEGKLPDKVGEPGIFEIEVTEGGPEQVNGLSMEKIREFFPNH